MESLCDRTKAGRRSADATPVLRGVLAPNLSVLFVGFEPGPTDLRLRYHHARRNNQFWRLLAQSKLTSERLKPEQDVTLPKWGLGLLHAVSRRKPAGSRKTGRDLELVAPRLVDVVRSCPPRILAYVGKGVYLAAAGRSSAPWGWQATSLFQGLPDVVLPSPSGKVRLTFDAKLRYYEELARLARQSPPM